jgi:non-ribosomal peptide synthetase component F
MDVVLHHTPVTFDIHLLEIIGTLIMGGQVIVLHPNGNFDMNVFSKTISHQQVTCLNIAPSFLTIVIDHLGNIDNKNCLKTLRCVLSHGKKPYYNHFCVIFYQ